jgi:predicted Fe-Mo cluster-binding NifX family protein
MKVAVATTDGVAFSQHFGQSAGFVVFEVEDGVLKGRELRTNDRTPHAQGLCDGASNAPASGALEQKGQHGEGRHGHGAHSCGSIADLLRDCEAVLCGGMGAGAANALSQQGIQPLVLPLACSADEAIAHYLNGTTKAQPGGFCNCQH